MNAHAATALGVHRSAHHAHSGRLSRLEVAVLTLAVIALVACAAIGMGRGRMPVVDRTMTVKIAPSDTLWDLARAHPVQGLSTAQTVAVIRQLNEMSTSAIVAGETLKVPASGTISAAVASR